MKRNGGKFMSQSTNLTRISHYILLKTLKDWDWVSFFYEDLNIAWKNSLDHEDGE